MSCVARYPPAAQGLRTQVFEDELQDIVDKNLLIFSAKLLIRILILPLALNIVGCSP